ncbi:MAG: Phosphoribosylformylglycinamidine cyclo-ligase [Firmicutes bacterium ADurb.Bin456]|nr:MAG: Phosphoribosylformylglycinamidine cyclo-ligase [Firmicutes bacterium ADurb.Bin456]
MPGFYGPGEYDLAGFAVGVVERSRIIDGRGIKPGDKLIGLPSSGLHSNGYSLARKVLLDRGGYSVNTFLEQLGRTVGEEMLEPTRIYVKTVLPLLEHFQIKGLAHITGGGLTENIPRILPAGTGVRIHTGTWPVPPVFGLIQEIGGITGAEMRRTFNMGIGLVAVVAEDEAMAVMADLEARGEKCYLVGEVVVGEGSGEVEYL